MPTLKLTDAAVQRLKGEQDKRVEYFDLAEPGFALRIAGTPEKPKKSWAFLYRVKGEVPPPGKKRAPLHRLTIGPYPAYGLKEAREAAREARKLADRGIDPATARKDAAAAAQRVAREMRTLASVTDEFLIRFMEKGGRKQRPHSPRYIAETRRNFKNHVLPVWGGRDIKSIARRDVVALLDKIADGPGPIAANRTRAALSTMFTWALRRDLVEVNPVLQTEPPGQEKERDRVLSEDEIIALWKAASTLGYPFGAFTQMLVATGQRRCEVASMRRQDIDGDIWVIPAAMTKAGREHAVALSARAIQILEGCERISDVYVFTTRRDRPISGYSKAKAELDQKIAEAGFSMPPWRIHDVRRSVATNLGKLGVSRFIIGQILNHSDRSVTGVYDRYEYLEEKRAALEAWGRHIEKLIGRERPAPDNVIPLAAAG
jgi:integrase